MLLLLLWYLLVATACSSEELVEFSINTSHHIAVVNEKYLSHTLNAVSVMMDPWRSRNMLSTKIQKLMKPLTPAYLRFGGTRSNSMTFNESATGNSYFAPPKEKRALVLTRTDWDRLHEFANLANWTLLTCLNDDTSRHNNGSWNPKNSLQLIDYSMKKNYHPMHWTLGNEPMLFYNVSGEQIGEGLEVLRSELNKRGLHEEEISAPDVAESFSQKSLKLISTVIENGGNVLNAISLHQYYGNADLMKWQDFVNTTVLNKLSRGIQAVKDIIRRSRNPDLSIWYTETGSAYNNGVPGLLESYASAVAFADKICLAAKHNVQLLTRESLFIGAYQLLSKELKPLPEYWISVLAKRLLGTNVFEVKLTNREEGGNIRLYAHKVSKNSEYLSNATALFAINLNHETVALRSKTNLGGTRVDYLLTPANGDMMSNSVKLNGNILKVDNETGDLPSLIGIKGNASRQLSLPALSMGFYVYQ